MKKNYEFIDHTADLGIMVFGNDLNQLFVNAANALSEILTDTSKVKNVITKEINVDGDDLEQLMINWLHEVLYYYEVYSILLKTFDIININTPNETNLNTESLLTLKAFGSGEIFDQKKHSILTEIKAVTYHQIEVKEHNGKWQARIIFDL